jgi:hypothetical protein
VRAMLNMTKYSPKNILLLFDLDFPFLKDLNFQEILFQKIDKEDHFYFFSAFDNERIYVYKNQPMEETHMNIADEIDNQYSFIDDYKIENIYQKEDSEASVLTDDSKEDYNNYKEFFNFINSFPQKEHYYEEKIKRFDYALKRASDFYKFMEKPKNNNFLIAFTTIDAGFVFEAENIKQLSSSLFHSQYTLIICIMFEEKIFQEETYKIKYECYKKFIQTHVINGHIFLFRSFSLLKYILNFVNPQTFKEFETFSMQNILSSVDAGTNIIEKGDELGISIEEDDSF